MRRTFVVCTFCACSVSALLVAQGRDPNQLRQPSPGPEGAPVVKVVKRDYDMAALLKSREAPLPDDVKNGRTVWLQRCAFCHDGVGTPTYNTLGPYLDAELVMKRGDAAVKDKILKGSTSMPSFQSALKPAQIDQLISFLKTIGPDQKPTDAQKAGKSNVGADL